LPSVASASIAGLEAVLEWPAIDRRRASRRERKQRWKRRQRRGRIVVPVEIGEAVISGLVAVGWLDADVTDARRIGAAIAAMLADSFK
jgi:hypothetical protein